jgi:hypothetical protein
VNLGDAYWVQINGGHLWVIISHPTQDNKVACVNFTTNRTWADDTCVVQSGEHKDIRHESVIAYKRAKLRSQSTIEEQLRNGTFLATDPVSAELLQRIQEGALNSIDTPQNVQSIVRQSLL